MENTVKLQIPISVSYPALESVLKEQMVGEYIPKPEEGSTDSPYAQILDISMEGGDPGGSNVLLRIRIRILRTVLKRDQVNLLVVPTLRYDNATEELYVQDFRLFARTSSRFYNSALELLANKVAYNQILKKTRFNLKEIIAKELGKANGLLESGIELKGAKLVGKVETVRAQDIMPHPDRVSLMLELQGSLEAEISDILSLMPPK